MMKKILLIALLATPFLSKAQVNVSFGPEVGFSIPTLRIVYENNPIAQDVNYVGGAYHVGAAAHVQIGDWLAVRPAVFYKGIVMTEIDGVEDVYFSDLEIPINILFSRRTSRNHKIFFGAGPNILYSLNAENDIGTGRTEIKLGSGDLEINPIAVGINAKVGMQFGFGLGFNFYANAGLGNRYNGVLANAARMRSADVFGLSLSFLFGGRSSTGGGF